MATLRVGGQDWAITKKNSAQEKVPKKYRAKQVTQKNMEQIEKGNSARPDTEK